MMLAPIYSHNPLSPDGTFLAQYWIREKSGNAREWRDSVAGRSLTRGFSPFLPYRFWRKSLCSEFGHLVVRWPKFTRFGQLVTELKWKSQTGQYCPARRLKRGKTPKCPRCPPTDGTFLSRRVKIGKMTVPERGKMNVHLCYPSGTGNRNIGSKGGHQ